MDYEKLAEEFVKLFGRMERQKERKKVTDSMHGEQFILFFLSAHTSSVIPSEIGREMCISSARIAAALNSLEEKGFITRRIDTDDRRRILVDLTESGRTEVEKHKREIKTTTANMMRYLGEHDAKELVRIMMLYNSWILTLTAVAASVIGFGLMMLITGRSQKYFDRQQAELGCINGYIEEYYSGHNIVKVYNGSAEAKRVFEESNGALYASAWKSQFLSGMMMPLMSFVGNLGYVAVCVIGAVLAMNGTITFGVIVAFMMYIRLFTQPLSQIAQAVNNLQRTAAASERVFEFLGEEEMENEDGKTARLHDIQGEVTFDHVKFGYTPEKTIIHDFSAEVKPGQKIAIVGPTGAGKTTMVNLLMRFYETDSGEIRIDGTPIKDVPRSDVHSQFGMVLQDTWLFEGTIKENITYSKENVSDEDVIRACRTVGLHHFIRTLPDGYDTVLNDKASLSEGQKQLMTIARAMIQNAPLLILDEATSSVDTRTERMVQKAMNQLTEGRTSFVIAHRLSTIKDADLILVMKDGDVIESGNHKELLAEGGFYANLYNSQFEKEAS